MGSRRDTGVFAHTGESTSQVVPHWVLSSKPHRHAPANLDVVRFPENDDYVGPRRSSLASPCPPGPFDIISRPLPHKISHTHTHRRRQYLCRPPAELSALSRKRYTCRLRHSFQAPLRGLCNLGAWTGTQYVANKAPSDKGRAGPRTSLLCGCSGPRPKNLHTRRFLSAETPPQKHRP